MSYDDVYVVIYWLFIVINYINLFVFDDEIEMKNRSTIQTLTFVQTNLDHLYMKLNMPGTCNHPVSVQKIGTWRFFWLLLFGSQSSPCKVGKYIQLYTWPKIRIRYFYMCIEHVDFLARHPWPNDPWLFP